MIARSCFTPAQGHSDAPRGKREMISKGLGKVNQSAKLCPFELRTATQMVFSTDCQRFARAWRIGLAPLVPSDKEVIEGGRRVENIFLANATSFFRFPAIALVEEGGHSW